MASEEEKQLDENNDSSSSHSSSDEDESSPGEEFSRILSAVVVLNEKLSSSSSSSEEEGHDEAAPAEDFIIHSTVHDSDPVTVSEAEEESIAEAKSEVAAGKGESYAEETNGVEVEATEVLVVMDESESSESDGKVLPIEEEEENQTLVADSLETGDLASKETEYSPPENILIGSGSAAEVHADKREIPESSGIPVLITTATDRLRNSTSWRSCCGLFEVWKHDR